MKLTLAKAAQIVTSVDPVLGLRLMEIQLDTMRCEQNSCDLNRQGECTVGYCRRADLYLSK